MSGKEILPPDAPREQWLTARRRGIGASEIAAVLGISNYATPLSVWLTKTGRQPEFSGNPASKWGTMLEASVCDWYATETGKTLHTGGLWQSADHEWMLATPDRIVDFPQPELVEAKTANWRVAHHWDNGVPLYYYAQVQQQIAATGIDRAVVVAAIGGAPPRWWEVVRDEPFIDRIVDAGTKLWAHVLSDTPPDMSMATSDQLAVLTPTVEGKQTDLGFEAEIAYATYLDARTIETEAHKRKEEAALILRAAMGDANVGLINGYPAVKLTPTTKGETLDESALRAEHPALWRKYLLPFSPTTPRLTVK